MIRLRWAVVVFWCAIVSACLLWLPGLDSGHDGGLRGLIPKETPAVRYELRSLELFDFPFIARTVLVQRDPDGLSVYAQARTVTNAVGVSTGRYEDAQPVVAALPLLNAEGLFPGSAEQGTTALSYLFFERGHSLSSQTRAARRYADNHFTRLDHIVGVTGSVPARAQQGRTIRDHLPLVELTTLAAIVLIVAISFRSVVAPVATLAATGVAYVVVLRTSALMASLLDISSPSEIEPVVAAMLLGISTDYVVFYLSALRVELNAGLPAADAVRVAVAQFTPIVAVAGLAVAAGTAALAVADSAIFNAMGPGLALTVIIGLAVATTLVPALMAILGRALFWPTGGSLRARRGATMANRRMAAARHRLDVTARIADSRRTAAWTAVGCVVGLGLLSLPVTQLKLSVSFVDSLPSSTNVREAAESAQVGFAEGILSPTEIIVEGSTLDRRRPELAGLGDALRRQPGVAGVIGPGDLPRALEREVMVSDDGEAARYLVVLDSAPLGATAIETVRRLDEDLRPMLVANGLADTTTGIAGDSATASFVVRQTEQDVMRIALAAIVANLFMLLLFLRAVVASCYLLVASVLSLTATLGLTTLVFDRIDPGEGLVFYVPFTAAVLLLAFGSDYNIFGVGHVWDLARRRPLPEAIKVAMPRTTRAILAAGLALAASFGLLALVPLDPFRQLAFAMSVGIAIDVLVVRSLLMPALLSAVGPVSAWPSRNYGGRRPRDEAGGEPPARPSDPPLGEP